MNRPKCYLALKPIINQTLFDLTNVDDYFKKEEKLIFSNLFVGCHAQFLDDPTEDQHELLLMTLVEYCQEADSSVRKDIVEVILDNDAIVQTIVFMSALNDGKHLDMNRCFEEFILELKAFLDGGDLTPKMGHFFLLHFRNFEDIRPSDYVNYELDRTQYNKLISQYLSRQTNFKFT